MKRRNVVLGLGTIAASAATALGSGAFTSVEADRNISVETAADDEAFLLLESVGTDDRSQARTDKLEFRFPSPAEKTGVIDDNVQPDGLGTDSVYRFGRETEGEPLFRARNQGTQSVEIFGRQPDRNGDVPKIDVFAIDSGELLTEGGTTATVDVGDPIDLGLRIDTMDVDVRPDDPYELTLTIVADANHDQ